MIKIKLNSDSRTFRLIKKQPVIKLLQVGRRGATGADGAPGEAATIEVGTVTTLNPNQPATVTNSGDEQDAVFDFGIPKGEQGEQGEAGQDGAPGVVQSIVAGTNVTVDDTDPANPVVSASGGGGGGNITIGDEVIDGQPFGMLNIDADGNLSDEAFKINPISIIGGLVEGFTLKPSNFDQELGLGLGGFDASDVGGTEVYAVLQDINRSGAFGFVKLDKTDPDNSLPNPVFYVSYDSTTEQTSLIFTSDGINTPNPSFVLSVNNNGLNLSENGIDGGNTVSRVDTDLSSNSNTVLPTVKAIVDALNDYVQKTTTINGQALSSNITLDQDDVGDGTTYKQYSQTEKSKLAGIETGADVTDATNVAAAGAFMKSSDDTDDITVGTTNKFATADEKTKLGFIAVTQAVDLDTMESDIAGKQPLDSDLTTIAGLSPSNDDIIQRKAGAWANRTPAQFKTDLALTKSDVGLSSVDNTSDATKNAAAATLTNKRITQRVLSIASSATPTIDTDSYDRVKITALATNITSMTTNLSGTPTDFQSLVIRIKDDGTPRTIAWGSSFESAQATLPTTTTANKVLLVGFFWNSDLSKWRCAASGNEA